MFHLAIIRKRTGFSNNARSLFEPPSFDDANFKFNEMEMTTKIILK
jgi:uncharacterized protein (DUF2141 family)